MLGNGPNTVSESTVSNTELSEFFCPHRAPGRGLSEFLSAYYCVTKRTHRVFRRTHRVCPQNSVRLRNSTLETVFRYRFLCFSPLGFRKKGSFGKGVFSEKSKFSRDSRAFLETLEILENPQTVENKGESDHFLEI